MFNFSQTNQPTIDSLRDSMGAYLNLEAFKNAEVIAIERMNIATKEQEYSGEKTVVTFYRSDSKETGNKGPIVELTFYISRDQHKQLVAEFIVKKNKQQR